MYSFAPEEDFLHVRNGRLSQDCVDALNCLN